MLKNSHVKTGIREKEDLSVSRYKSESVKWEGRKWKKPWQSMLSYTRCDSTEELTSHGLTERNGMTLD